MSLFDCLQKGGRCGVIRWAALLVAVLFTALFAWFLLQHEQAPLAGEGGQSSGQISGWLVFHRPDGIYRQHSQAKLSELLAPHGRYPRWSPKGKEIAFLRGKGIMLMRADGSGLRQVGTGQGLRALCFHPSGKAILYLNRTGLHSLTIKNGKIKTLLSGYDFYELDIAENGRELVATVKTLTGYQVRFFDLAGGESFALARGCSAMISPDGNYAAVNNNSHKKLTIYRLVDRQVVGTLPAPAGTSFDNHSWSNHPDWLVSMVEKQGNIYLHHIPTRRAFRITSTGDCDRADFFVD